MYLDGASEGDMDDPNFTEAAGDDGPDGGGDDEGQYESDNEGGSPGSRGGSRMSSERSPHSPLDEMLSLPSLASPGPGTGYNDDMPPPGHHPGIGYKNIQNGFRPVGADPRDSKNPLSITSLTAGFGAREGQIPSNMW